MFERHIESLISIARTLSYITEQIKLKSSQTEQRPHSVYTAFKTVTDRRDARYAVVSNAVKTTCKRIESRGYCFCLALPIRRRCIQIVSFYLWTIVQDTGAPTTHDKPGSLTCPV